MLSHKSWLRPTPPLSPNGNDAVEAALERYRDDLLQFARVRAGNSDVISGEDVLFSEMQLRRPCHSPVGTFVSGSAGSLFIERVVNGQMTGPWTLALLGALISVGFALHLRKRGRR